MSYKLLSYRQHLEIFFKNLSTKFHHDIYWIANSTLTIRQKYNFKMDRFKVLSGISQHLDKTVAMWGHHLSRSLATAGAMACKSASVYMLLVMCEQARSSWTCLLSRALRCNLISELARLWWKKAGSVLPSRPPLCELGMWRNIHQ